MIMSTAAVPMAFHRFFAQSRFLAQTTFFDPCWYSMNARGRKRSHSHWLEALQDLRAAKRSRQSQIDRLSMMRADTIVIAASKAVRETAN